jgi:hypothetical protein
MQGSRTHRPAATTTVSCFVDILEPEIQVLGLIPYGTITIPTILTPGPFNPAPTISKGVALTFSF